MSAPALTDNTEKASAAYCWTAWSLSGIFYGYIFFVRVAPSVMISELMRDFAVSGAILGNLSAVYFYAYAGMQIPVGILHDRFGPRRMLTGAALLCAVGGVLFAVAEHLWVAYAGRLLVGVGAGFALVGTFKVASMWHPPRRFAMLAGFAIAIGMAGAIGAQAPLAAIVALTGWRAAMVVAAAFGCALAALIWLVVRDGADGRGHAETAPKIGVLASLRDVVTNVQTWYMALVCGATGVPVLAFASLWGVPYMVEAHGISRPNAALSTSLLLIGFGLGGTVFGWFSDYIGRRKPQLVVSTVVMLLSFAAAVYIPGLPLWLVRVLLLINGLAVGASAICYVAAREHNRPDAVGVSTAAVNVMAGGIGGGMQPVIGWVLDLYWEGRMEGGARLYSVESYKLGFLAVIAMSAVAIVVSLLSRETYCRQVRDAG